LPVGKSLLWGDSFVGGVLKISGEIAIERAIVRNINRRIIMEKIKPSATGS